MYNDRVLLFKNKVVEALQQMHDDTIETLDVFMYDGKRSLRLTFYGFKKLKEEYEFLEIEIGFDVDCIAGVSAIDQSIKGMYYLTVDKKDRIYTIRTTDRKFVKTMALYRYNLTTLMKKTHKGIDITKHLK